MKYEKGYWLTKDSRTFLSRGYLTEGQTAEERIKIIAKVAEERLGIAGYAAKFEDYMLRGWISLASPVWSNYGTDRGLPISCNGSYISDEVASILEKTAEIGMMSKHGAGTSAYFGGIRGRGSEISTGGKADGPVHFIELIDKTTNIISQGSTRRGHCAVWLDVEHPNIKEFLTIKTEGSPIQNVSFGVCITDAWMESMLAGDEEKQDIWVKILERRAEKGYPYIFYTDNVNNNKPEWYKEYRIWASNMCVEIALPSSADESFVCCLASTNVLHYDDWKKTDLVEVVTLFLDTVITEYIDKIESNPRKYKFMEAALKFAKRHRAIGIGVIGWHSYLQRNSIAFESTQAKDINIEVWKFLDERSREASKTLAELFGEPEVLVGWGYRNATRLALAPTTSSSFILGAPSPQAEPEDSNYYTKDLAKGKFTVKNPFLKEILITLGKDTKEVWKSILMHGGSVQHLEFLTQHEKNVFKTFGEISQFEHMVQTADRQQFIDQSQSFNVMIHPSADMADVHELMVEGWRMGVKTWYYQHGANLTQEFSRDLLVCVACSL
jgi:ribonucleoside-diphosphate reductase alpha chain